MALVVLQWVIQRVERDPELLALEHNEMAALYRELAEMFSGEHGAAGERLRARAEELGKAADLPIPPSPSAVSDAHHRLSEELIGTLSELDELIRAGDPQADAALLRVRQHLSSRATRDFQSLTVSSLVKRSQLVAGPLEVPGYHER
jgi:hypothetical protein